MPDQLKEPDSHTTPEAKNRALAHLLLQSWNPYEIAAVERSETKKFKGWIATLKDSNQGGE